MRLKCNLCERELKPHCRVDRDCGWLVCTNRTCDAKRYDVYRGILLHEDGRLEQLGAAG